ncbi:hypothetical protein C0Q70_14484 [Pomacea canaliculata]|uniref:Annexin n=1 Tax=Pomacea canaliculata TaxID=400727 RepID=A0A2T7P074_POMCA|nr:hypothetical protein C0Q70_14484 [Pomacea canaliculata]
MYRHHLSQVDDKVKVDQAEVDARHLFRVAKVLAPPHDIFIRTLVRRTPGQRSQIKKRFKQLYELDLVDELKKGLGKEWHVLIDALLEKNGEDAGSSAEEQRAKRGPDSYSPAAIHTALQRGDVPTVVQVLVTKTDHKIARLRESYTKEYSVSLEAEISERIPEPERLFLLTLLKRKKDRGKADVHQDAQDLFEYGEGRWTSSSGLFLKLLEERNISHMREVLLTYEQVSSGVSALQAIEQDISPSYAKAVEAFLGPRGENNQREKSSSGRGRGRGRGQDMDPGGAGSGSRSPSRDGSTDMRTIRIAYKKKYGKALEVDLEERSRHPTVSILVKLILKSPAKDARKDQHQDSIPQRHGVKDGDRKNQNDRQESGHGKGHRERHDEGQGHDLTQGRRDKKGEG